MAYQHHYHYQEIETPFKYRHCCWFCGEPTADTYAFPQCDNIVIDCCHPPLRLPCCQECLKSAAKSKQQSIWSVQAEVKKYLIDTYQKDLAIGINWTKEELENSEFDQGNFAGFQRSAWMMYEIAKTRVNFNSWPLVVGGINIEEWNYQSAESFIFDGVSYPSIHVAIEHYAKTFDLHREYFQSVLLKLGNNNFAQAVRFCRLLVGSTPQERSNALKFL